MSELERRILASLCAAPKERTVVILDSVEQDDRGHIFHNVQAVAIKCREEVLSGEVIERAFPSCVGCQNFYEGIVRAGGPHQGQIVEIFSKDLVTGPYSPMAIVNLDTTGPSV